MEKNELDEQLKILKEKFSTNIMTDGTIYDLRKYFKDKFNENIVQVGDKLTFNFHSLCYTSPKWKKKFKNDPIQPITVTYKRADIIFYTYDKHPEFGEEYIMWESDLAKWLYPTELKLSVLFDKKSYLKEKDPEEWYIETNLFSINDKYTKLINDINFD